jgi:hypothetical protein
MAQAKLIKFRSDYESMAADWLREYSNGSISLPDIKTGVDAWAVAHRSGIVRNAYNQGRDVLDAHIQTILESIMPNAVFLDQKRY